MEAVELQAADHSAGREHLTNEMVRHARTALRCHQHGNTTGYEYHRTRTRQLADLLEIPTAAASGAH